MVPADSSHIGGPVMWISWPGERGCGCGAGCMRPPAFSCEWWEKARPDGVGPELCVFRKWGRTQGPTGELKIQPVRSCSPGRRLCGRPGWMSCGPCLGDILFSSAPGRQLKRRLSCISGLSDRAMGAGPGSKGEGRDRTSPVEKLGLWLQEAEAPAV